MAFVVSSGALTSINRSVAAPVLSVQVAADLTLDYAALWRVQPELRTVVDFLARNIAQLGLHVFRRVSDVDRERLAGHPLADLLDRPNPFTTRYRMVDALVHDLCIFDAAYLVKVRAESGEPVGLIRTPPSMTQPTGDNWLTPTGFEVRGNRGKQTLAPDQVVYFRGYNPTDGRLGSSPIESLRQILAEEWAAATYRAQLWRNGARMSGYLKRPIDAPDWGDRGRDRFRSQWQSQYAGDGPGAGGTPILEDGMEFVPAAQTAKDSQYVESRKLTREEVARAFHVPLPMVGILDHATYSNIREQHKQLYMDCLGPWLEMIQQELELQLVPDMPDTDRVYVEFNFAAKLSGSFEEQAAQLQAATGAPWMTRNEARARLNLPQVDGGDDLVVPLNVLLSGGGAAPVVTEPDDAGETKAVEAVPKTRTVRFKAIAPAAVTESATRTLARFFERQGRSVLSRLGERKTRFIKAAVDDVLDVQRWNQELSADLLKTSTAAATAAWAATWESLPPPEDPAVADPAVMDAYLTEQAAGVAAGINATTALALEAVLAAEDDDILGAVALLYAGYRMTRAPRLAQAHVTAVSGFATVDAARRVDGADEGRVTKTWVAVVDESTRSAHKQMNGETVALNAKFSNGARWPADSLNLDVDDLAGCRCELVISVP